jgi:membrane protease YdiL (CAAX protease family)
MGSLGQRIAATLAFGGMALLLFASIRNGLAPADPAADLGRAALTSQGVLGFLVLGCTLLVEAPRRARLGWTRGRLRGSAPLAAALGFVAASMAIDTTLQRLAWHAGSSLDAMDHALARAHGTAIPLLLLGLVVAPPLCEELLFRGLLQPRLVRGLGPVAGVALTAALFGASHLGPAHAAGAFALGIYLGVVALLDGGIRTAVLCHGLNNGLAVGAALLSPPGVPAPRAAGAWRIAVGLAVAALALETVRRSARRAGTVEGLAGLGDPSSPGLLEPGGSCS